MKEMMDMRMRIVVATVSLMLVGAAALAQSVTYDYDKSADFTRVKTYAWTRGTPLSDDLNHKRVMRAIDDQLTLKGMTRVANRADADVLIAYHARFDRNLDITGSSSGWGPYGLGGGRFGSARVGEVTVGTLLVEMRSADADSIVWRAAASADMNPAMSPEKREKSLNKATEKLFKHYPPKRK